MASLPLPNLEISCAQQMGRTQGSRSDARKHRGRSGHSSWADWGSRGRLRKRRGGIRHSNWWRGHESEPRKSDSRLREPETGHPSDLGCDNEVDELRDACTDLDDDVLPEVLGGYYSSAESASIVGFSGSMATSVKDDVSDSVASPGFSWMLSLFLSRPPDSLVVILHHIFFAPGATASLHQRFTRGSETIDTAPTSAPTTNTSLHVHSTVSSYSS